jgi:hypothetical protein
VIDVRAVSDEEILTLLELARGYDRVLLVEALGYTRGEVGVPFLRDVLAKSSGRGSTYLRISAMTAIATRLGIDAVADLVPLLSGGNLQTQLAALSRIQMKDDGRTSGEVLGWLQRRLRAEGRANTYGDYEISGVLRYAIRVGALHPAVALLEANQDRLQPGERQHLDRVWPPEKRSRFLVSERSDDGPDATAVEDWFQTSAVELTDDENLQDLQADVGPAIERLRKRHQRQTRHP